MTSTTSCCYTELNEPQSVTYSCRANFISPAVYNLPTSSNTPADNLVVVRGTSTIEVYSIVDTQQQRQQPTAAVTTKQLPLQRLLSVKAFGDICGIERLHLPHCQLDALVVLCSEAKVSIIYYNQAEHRIDTLWQHQWEDQRHILATTYNTTHQPTLRVDPLYRCIALYIYGSHLAIVPISQDALQYKHTNLELAVQCIQQPYLIDLPSIDVSHVRSFTMLAGFNEPTVCILYERVLTWVGRYAVENKGCSLRTITCMHNLQQAIHISSVDYLASDAYSVVACQPALGGALVFSTNRIYHFNNHSIDYVLSGNEYGDLEDVHYTVHRTTTAVTIFDKTQLQWLTATRAMLGVGDGSVYVLAVRVVGNGIQSIDMQRVGLLSPSTTMVQVSRAHTSDSGWLFCGSRFGFSALLTYDRREGVPIDGEPQQDNATAYKLLDDIDLSEADIEADLERALTAKTTIDVKPTTNGIKAEDVEESKEESPSVKAEPADDFFSFGSYAEIVAPAEHPEFVFSVVDKLISFAPIADFTVGKHVEATDVDPTITGKSSSVDDIDERKDFDSMTDDTMQSATTKAEKSSRQPLELTSAVGYEQSGSLQITTEAITPIIDSTELLKLSRNDRLSSLYIATVPLRQQQREVPRHKSARHRKRKHRQKEDDMVVEEQKQQEDEPAESAAVATLLLTSSNTATAVLQLHTTESGTRLHKVRGREHHLHTDAPTVTVGIMHNQQFTVQVYADGITVINNTTSRYERTKFANVSIVQACITEQHIGLLLHNGTIRLLTVTVKDGKMHIVQAKHSTIDSLNSRQPAITAMTLYSDDDGFLKRCTATAAPNGIPAPPTQTTFGENVIKRIWKPVSKRQPSADSKPATEDNSHQLAAELEDELDRLLAGKHDEEESKYEDKPSHDASMSTVTQQPTGRSYLLISRKTSLELYHLSSNDTLELCWKHDTFTAGLSVLHSASLKLAAAAQRRQQRTVSAATAPADGAQLPTVQQLVVVTLNTTTPFVIATTSTNEVLVYRCAVQPAASPALTLVREAHNIPFRTITHNNQIARKLHVLNLVEDANTTTQIVCVTGKHPYIIHCQRSTLRTHALLFPHNAMADLDDDSADYNQDDSMVVLQSLNTDTDDDEQQLRKRHFAVVGFAAAPQQLPPATFFAADTAGRVHTCRLPVDFQQQQVTTPLHEYDVPRSHIALDNNADSPMFHQYLALGTTPRFVARHAATNTYAVAVANKKQLQSMEEINERSVRVYDLAFEVLFYSASDHTLLGRYDAFEENECITCMKSCVLGGTEFSTDKEAGEYLVIGTALMGTEDQHCRGRIIVLDLYYAMGVTQTSVSRQMLKFRPYVVRDKTAVTAVAVVDGMLLAVIGTRVFLYDYRDKKELVGRAFMDTTFYIVSVAVLKTFIVLGDVTKGIHLAYWDNVIRQLLPIARASEVQQVAAVELMADRGTALNVIATDMQQNIRLYRYAAIRGHHELSSSINIHTHNGEPHLALKADFFTGAITQTMTKLQMRSPLIPVSALSLTTDQQQQVVKIDRNTNTAYLPGPYSTMMLGATLDGHFQSLAPLDDVMYRRLQSLHTAITYSIPQIGGLNARSHRLLRQRGQHTIQHRRGVIDGELIKEYISMDVYTQQSLAKQIGTTREQILDNLATITWMTTLLS